MRNTTGANTRDTLSAWSRWPTEQGLTALDPADPDALCGLSHLGALKSGEGCGCGDMATAMTAAYEAFVRERLPDSEFVEHLGLAMGEKGLNVEVRLRRSASEDELRELQLVIDHALHEFRRRATWIRFLWRMSRCELRITAAHPDRAGGLAFLGKIQGLFGVLIFAIGAVAATDALMQMLMTNIVGANVYLTVVGFLVLGPAVFLIPLLFFSKKMYTARLQGTTEYAILLTQLINAFESRHVREDTTPEARLESIQEFAALSSITSLHDHVARMRVVPFDLGTLSRLVLSSATPMLPLVIRFVPWPGLRHTLELVLGH